MKGQVGHLRHRRAENGAAPEHAKKIGAVFAEPQGPCKTDFRTGAVRSLGTVGRLQASVTGWKQMRCYKRFGLVEKADAPGCFRKTIVGGGQTAAGLAGRGRWLLFAEPPNKGLCCWDEPTAGLESTDAAVDVKTISGA